MSTEGAFDDVLKTRDTNPLEPDVVEYKCFGRGRSGPCRILSGGSDREELVEFTAGE